MVSLRWLPSVSLFSAGFAIAFPLLNDSPRESSGVCACLTAEQREVLRSMTLVKLDDGLGGQVPTVRFTGVNVQVVSGSGATNGFPADPGSYDPDQVSTNGVGNLIVGYNEPGNFSGDVRTGSHNLVLGNHNTFTSFAGIAAGQHHRITGPFASATAGAFHWASAPFASVSGGDSNEAHAQYASVHGGEHNLAVSFGAAVSGGFGNQASGNFATVGGGQSNIASGSSAYTAGGALNLANGDVATACGGVQNVATGLYSTVGGGESRAVIGESDWRAGDLFQDN